MPFSDSSDDSSDGEDHVGLATCTASTINSHNSSSTDNTESNTSGSASSPSKSAKTSSSLSPAKRSDCDSPKIKARGLLEFDWFSHLIARSLIHSSKLHHRPFITYAKCMFHQLFLLIRFNSMPFDCYVLFNHLLSLIGLNFFMFEN